MKSDFITLSPGSQKKHPSRRMVIVGIAALFLILITIIIIVIINNSKPSYDTISITNFSELPTTPPEDNVYSLKRRLYGILSDHFSLDHISKPIEATIRPESSMSGTQDGINRITFILDVDQLQQSYNVSLVWSNSAEIYEDTFLECTRRDESKYPDVLCYGTYYNSDSPELYLPYDGKTPSRSAFTASFSHTDSLGNDHISVLLHSCDDPDLKSEAVSATKDYLESSGFDPDKFIYSRSADGTNCN